MSALATAARSGWRRTAMSLKRTLLQTEQRIDDSSLAVALSRMDLVSSSMREEAFCRRIRGQQAWFHSYGRSLDSDGRAAEETSSSGTLNPLQQVPQAGTSDPAVSQYSPSRAGEKRARAILRGARIGPRKLNTFVDMLRGLHIEDALIQCQVHHKKAARMCEKLLRSAKANAVTNHGLDGENLKVEQAWVGKGQYLRRVSIHGRGRSGVMHKTRSHLTVILKEEATPRRTKIIPMLQERKKWRRGDDVAITK